MVTPRTGRPRGRPPGSKDGALTLRTLTAEQAEEINRDCAVLKARTRLAAWEALAKAVDTCAALPAKERAQLLSVVLRHTEPAAPTAVAAVAVNVTGGQPTASAILRERLAALSAG